MFITDGSPADAQAGFEQIAKEMRATDHALTIVVGRLVNVVNMLEKSRVYRRRPPCYLVESGRDLSDIMSVDSVLSQVEYTVKAPFKPERGALTRPLPMKREIVQLFGYVRATAKKGDADVILKTPEGRPIYAVRNAGAGKAASWMSDLSGEWSRTMVRQRAGKAHDSEDDSRPAAADALGG